MWQAKKKKKFEDDRTPFVKKVDIVCKLVAILLAICIFGSIHVLVGGGGYEDSKVVHVLGVAASKVQTDDMEPEIEDECYKVEMEYPKPSKYTKNDIRLIQWKDGSHWYAKIGREDVVMYGKQKWDTKEEANKMAEKYLKENYYE